MYLLSKAQDFTRNATRLRKKLQIEYLEVDTGSMVTRLCCIGRFTGNRDGILLVFEHQKSPGVGQSERKVKQPSELQKLRLRSIFERLTSRCTPKQFPELKEFCQGWKESDLDDHLVATFRLR